MARISEKALRPRQYVFNRLSSDRIRKLRPGVKKLLEQEKMHAVAARAEVRAAERSEAARHAENIVAGIKEADPENEQIRLLEKELEELRQKKRSLFATLKKTLDTDAAANSKDPDMKDSSKRRESSQNGDASGKKDSASSTAKGAPKENGKQVKDAKDAKDAESRVENGRGP